ncbi:hypothetical protein HZU40_28715 [Mycolicibacterium fluoranthenivorans]|uniref:PE-PGRS family protein n=1 Tax=Mycolicibacterium fluoranthenivorans TaxID=258505 RepID=A0A7G8PCP1_9MYCO|nr:hypothetical protein [Mycolicibacterium fluoranthenivorans]QNJ92107.1 hypothetical protein HZU40_28715 [Mycolicibacterium fluoranthenivorans]
MQLALRPYVTTGLALVSAGAIAITPITAPPPEVHMPAVALAANPVIGAYTQLLQDSWTDVRTVGSQAWNDGLPIFDQFVRNTKANFDILAQVPPNLINGVKYAVSQIRPTLDTAGTQLRAGQIDDAINTLWSGLVINPLIGVAFPLLNTLEIPVNMVKTFARVVEALPSAVLIGVGLPVLSMVTAVVNSIGTVAQGLYDGVTTGNLGAVLTTVLTAPATVLGGALNGDPNTGTVGLINGVIAGILSARKTIADAMAPPATATATSGATALKTAAANEVPAVSADTVTLDVKSAPTGESTKVAEAAPAVKDAEPAATEAKSDTAVTEKVPDTAAADTTKPDVNAKPDAKANGATDLSDGNKVTPGEKAGEKASDTKASEKAADNAQKETPAAVTTTATTPSATTSAAGDGSDAKAGATAASASSADAGE